MRLVFAVTALAIFVTSPVWAGDAAGQYHGAGQARSKEFRSPDGRTSLLSQPAGSVRGKLFGSILVLRRDGGPPVRIQAFQHGVTVFWHQDSQMFIATEPAGSANADCFLFDAGKPALLSILSTALVTPQRNQHASVTCSEWLDDNRIAVLVSGPAGNMHTKPLAHHFIYDVRSHEMEPTHRGLTASRHGPG